MSLKKIAQLAGTSISTVSRVLNHPEHTCNDPELYEKIWSIASELHYMPNQSARSLRCGETTPSDSFTVDIFLTRFQSLDNDAFFMELFQIIRKELLSFGCTFGELLTHVDITDLEKETTNRHVPYRSANTIQKEHAAPNVRTKADTGLVILGKCPEQLVPALKQRYAYIVGINRNPTAFLYDEIICNGATAAETALEYLISLGHREIAYIGDCTYETRYIGYYQTLLKHNLPLDYSNIHQTGQTRDEGYHVMQKILAGEHRPSAIFCANDTTAIGVLESLKKKRRSDNYTPSIVSIDNIEAAQHTNPMLTSVDIPKQEMGHLALVTLLDRRNHLHQKNIRLELPCQLIIRESCRTFTY